MQFVFFLILCFLVSLLARNRRPGQVAVFFIALFFTPLIGLIVALFAKKIPTPPEIPVAAKDDVENPTEVYKQVALVSEETENTEVLNDQILDNDDKSESQISLFCPACGKAIEADSAFCSSCGTRMK